MGTQPQRFTGLKEAMEVGDTQAVNLLTLSEFLSASSPALNAQVFCVVQQQSSILKGGGGGSKYDRQLQR